MRLKRRKEPNYRPFFMKIIIVFALLSIGFIGYLNDSDKAKIENFNLLPNPSFVHGTVDWSVSTGSFSTAGSGLNKYAVWDASAAAQTLCTDLVDTPARLAGENGYYYVKIQVPSGTATHTVYVSDGTNIISDEPTIINSTDPRVTSGNFIFETTSDDFQLCIESQADEPSINIYHGHVSDARNLTEVSQATFVGGMENAGAASCYYSENTSTGVGDFDDLGTGTSCAAWTVTSNGPGTISAQGTNDHRLVFSDMPPGEYVFKLTGSFYSATTSQACNYRLSDGTNNYQAQAVLSGGSQVMGPGLTYHVTVTTSGDRTYKLQAGDQAAGSCGWFNGANYTASWKVYRFPTSSETAVKADQTDRPRTPYSPSIVGHGTTTNVDFEYSRKGQFMIIKGYWTAGTRTATEFQIPLPGSFEIAADATSPIEKCGEAAWSGSSGNSYHILCTPGDTFLNMAAQSATGLTPKNGNALGSDSSNFSITAIVPIDGWTETMNAPLVKQSVVTSSDSVWAQESASISSTDVVSRESGDWINGNCTDATTGEATCNFNSGTFSDTPNCVCTTTSLISCRINAESSSSVTVLTFTESAGTIAAANAGFNLICHGPR